MAWTDGGFPRSEPYDPRAFLLLPRATLLQQLPAAVTPPGSAPSIRPGGHVREDLVELMMIQNAQMHQVIMNNMTVSTLRSFGYVDPPPGPEAPRGPVLIQEDEADPEIYHHYYQSAPCLSWPPWLLPHVCQQEPHASPPPRADRPAVPPPPPPPPPSTDRTAGVTVPPAADKNSATEGEAEKKRG